MASMATINSILINNFEYYFWCGFYRVTATGKDKKELIIGPYQGTVGCLHIPHELIAVLDIDSEDFGSFDVLFIVK